MEMVISAKSLDGAFPTGIPYVSFHSSQTKFHNSFNMRCRVVALCKAFSSDVNKCFGKNLQYQL
jgi:hypothetical protein